MFPTRRIVEKPFPGGEKFLVVLDVSPPARLAARGLWLLGGAGVVAGLLAGSVSLAALGLASGLLGAGIAAVTGGRETLVCQGDMLVHRRGGLRRGRNRASLLALRNVSARGEPRCGVALDLDRSTWRVGRGLSRDERGYLVWALERHVALSFRRSDASSFSRRTARAGRSGTPAPAGAVAVLKHRNPPPVR